MRETDDFILFIERMARIGVLIDKACRKELINNFTEKDLKKFMIEIYKDMLYFLKEPFKVMGKGKKFEKLEVEGTEKQRITFCRYKYNSSNKKNLRSIFVMQFVNNEYEAVFLYTFLEDGDKNKSHGAKSYKQAIKIARKRLDNYLGGNKDEV